MDSGIASISSVATARSPARPVASRTQVLLAAPIFSTLLRLSAPNVLNLLAIVGMITFDGIFIGRLGVDALAGVSLVFPWVMFMQHAAASGMGGGVSSAIARALGAGERELADALAAHAVMLAVALAAITSALMLSCGPLVYQLMGAREATLAAALNYSNVVFGGVISIWALNILANVVRGTGNMELPAFVIVGSVFAHMLLSSALIFGWGPFPELGPAGAGWGLIVSFGAGSIVLAAHLRSSNAPVTLAFRGLKLRKRLFADILRVGVPGMLNVGITNLSVVVLTGIAGRLGQETAIGYAMGARLEYILIPLAFGFGTAIVAMVGTNWGAKQFQRARRIAWVGAITVALACGAIGMFFALFPQVWMSLFSGNEEIVRAGSLYLRIVGPIYAFYGLGMALYFSTQGLGHVLPAVAANGARLLLSAGGGLAAVFWLGAGPAGFFTAIAGGFFLYGVLTVSVLFAVKEPARSRT
jgi:putative MATE family efflux protein